MAKPKSKPEAEQEEDSELTLCVNDEHIVFTKAEKRFIDAYNGNMRESADAAGISHVEAVRMMARNPYVKVAIKTRECREHRGSFIMDRMARQEMLTEVATNPNVNMRDRLRAIELLGKSEGDFIDKKQIGVTSDQPFMIVTGVERSPTDPQKNDQSTNDEEDLFDDIL